MTKAEKIIQDITEQDVAEDRIVSGLIRTGKKRIRNSFLTPLDVRVMPSGKRFKLLYPFTYYWKRYGVKVSVPAGFVTDFASIPQPVSFIISKLGRWNKPAVLHDWCYHGKVFDPQLSPPYNYYGGTRKEADLLFLDAMIDLGVKKWKRTVLYRFVRMFGWLAWRK